MLVGEEARVRIMFRPPRKFYEGIGEQEADQPAGAGDAGLAVTHLSFLSEIGAERAER